MSGINTVADVKDLIIMNNDDGGETPGSNMLADKYFRAGYEVVQFAWADAWKQSLTIWSGSP